MELSYEHPIDASSIYYVQVLKELKVFMLHGFVGDRVVIKHEHGDFRDEDVAWHSKIMGAIDPGAKAKALTPHEMSEIRNYLNFFSSRQEYIPGDTALAQTLALSPDRRWIKMKAHKLVQLDDASKKAGEKDKTDVRLIASLLNGPDGLEKLGRVIAADFFIGNTDRFVWPGPGGAWKGEGLKCLVNVGNVFTIIDPAQSKGIISGLDYLDPSSTTKSATGPVASWDKWSGLYLARGQSVERMKFCHGAIADLNFCLGPRHRKAFFLSDKRLGVGAANRLNAGVEQGATEIQNRLARYKQTHHGGLPFGIVQRLSKLQWSCT